MNALTPVKAARGRNSLLLLSLLVFSISPLAHAEPPPPVPPAAGPDLEVFVREGCPHCEAAKVLLEELRQERPTLTIVIHDVGRDVEAWERLRALAAARGLKPLGVPAFFVRDQLIIGYQGPTVTGARIRGLLAAPAQPAEEPPPGACRATPAEPCPETESTDTIVLPLFGPLTPREVGLPAFTIAIGLVDGFNPCAMWVLLFLLALLVHVHDRRRMALIAGTFVLLSGLVYFALMAAWLNLFLWVGLSRPIQVLIGLVALAIALIHLKDSLAPRRGLSLSIPDRAKPALYDRIRRVLTAENLPAALGSVAVLALVVNFVELLCTAGLPALYTHLLAARELSTWEYYGYLALYNLAYVTDDALMVTIAVVTLRMGKLQERGGRWLKLLSGLVMLVLGLLLILAPEWLMW